jgi:hypothetical protein
MKFKTRFERMEARRPTIPWVTPIIFHPTIELCKNGLREVGAFARTRLEGTDLMVWCGEDETNENFGAKT